MEGLEGYRARIDAIDAKIVRLLEERMDVCMDVARFKRARGLAVLQSERERTVLDKAEARLKNSDYAPGVRMVYESMMAASRALQHKLILEAQTGDKRPASHLPSDPRVAFPGAHGAFSEQAALDFFGPGARTQALDTFEDVSRALARGDVDVAVLPVENSTAGSVVESYRLIEQYALSIVGEVYVKVVHHLLGLKGAAIKDVGEVRSHPQAIAQCRSLLAAHPQWRVVPSENTALAARAVRDLGDPAVAAIASARSGEVYGLAPLMVGIQDEARNVTRFAILAREPLDAPGADKASVVFTLHDEVGALARVIAAFALEGVNLKRLESRPVPGSAWTYRFTADLEWTKGRGALGAALEAAGRDARTMALVGLYKKGEEGGQ